MTSFAARFAGVATLALAALPMAALATAATAAPVSIQVRDIDLNTASGQAAFHARAEQAADTFCKSERRPASRLRIAEDTCREAVKAEVAEKFVLAQAAQRAERGVYASR